MKIKIQKIAFLVCSLIFLLISPVIPVLLTYFFSKNGNTPNLPLLIILYIPLTVFVMRKLERIYINKLSGKTSNFVLWSILLGIVIAIGEIIFGVISVFEQITTTLIMATTIMGVGSVISGIIVLMIILVSSGAELYRENQKKPIASEKKKNKRRKKK